MNTWFFIHQPENAEAWKASLRENFKEAITSMIDQLGRFTSAEWKKMARTQKDYETNWLNNYEEYKDIYRNDYLECFGSQEEIDKYIAMIKKHKKFTSNDFKKETLENYNTMLSELSTCDDILEFSDKYKDDLSIESTYGVYEIHNDKIYRASFTNGLFKKIYYNIFTVNGESETPVYLWSDDETVKFTAEHDIVCDKNMTNKLNEFWDTYPDAFIKIF